MKKNQDNVAFPVAEPWKTFVFQNDQPLETQSQNPYLTRYPGKKMVPFPAAGDENSTFINPAEAASGYPYYPRKLIQVPPGALDSKNADPGFYFAFDQKLGADYTPGTFRFNGMADQLVWRGGTGWGVPDNTGNFMPLLLRADLERKSDPRIRFFLWRDPVPGSGLILNYQFSIPLNSTPQTVSALRGNTPHSFVTGFPADGPPIQSGRVILWKSFVGITLYDPQNAFASIPQKYLRLPQNLQATGFAIPDSGDSVIFALNDQTVRGFDLKGKELWRMDAMPPLMTTPEGFLFAVDRRYQKILVRNLNTGVVRELAALERFLSPQFNSFVLADFSGTKALFLIAPEQSRILAYRLR